MNELDLLLKGIRENSPQVYEILIRELKSSSLAMVIFSSCLLLLILIFNLRFNKPEIKFDTAKNESYSEYTETNCIFYTVSAIAVCIILVIVGCNLYNYYSPSIKLIKAFK